MLAPVSHQACDSSAIDADVDYALQVANSHLKFLIDMGISLPGTTILEIGPGKNFGPQLVLASYGAKVTVADRFLSAWDDIYHLAFYRRLAERWSGPRVAIDHAVQEGRHPAEWITQRPESAERLESLDDGAFDVVISNAVIEHVYDFPAVCRELARVTKISGLNSHQVDFRDHRDFTRPLEFLLMSDEEFSISSNAARLTFGNRWRPSEVARSFADVDFDIISADTDTPLDPAYLHEFIPRLRASGSRYRECPIADLRHGGTRWALRRIKRSGLWRLFNKLR